MIRRDGTWHAGTLVLIVALCLCGPAVAESQLKRYEYAQPHMGVSFRIALYSADEPTANKAAAEAFARIAELNGIMSDYDRNSELMRLCRESRPGRPVKVSPELFQVLKQSLELSRRTDGAFDVTVGPLVRLWRRARLREELPSPERLAQARSVVGYRHVRLDEKARTVELMKPGMRLDLGGIAKGYAVDEALRILRRNGILSAMVDGSGDIAVTDPPPGKPGWTIGIAPITSPESPPTMHLLLKNASVATSGDAFQYVEIGGRRYSHLIDPHTGLGLTQRSSVTVIASDGMAADSLASAVSILGPERGTEFINRTCGAECLVVTLEAGSPRLVRSRGFRRYVIPTPDDRS